ncbi:MAG: TIGR03016 family PEP-CTERM system-associated outer membrane protein [Paraglaciecola sp.]|uniref:TIGR03016 family PEP-CTERM system-associated outer membrane protein n=1 Tax=Paraglaciecola sp. TaxID=1920173 RepID=UPI0032982541
MSFRHFHSFNNKAFKLSLITLVSASGQLKANDLDVEGKVTATGYVYQTEISSEKSGTNKVASITPSVTAIYSNRRMNMSVNAEHIKVEQISGNVDADKEYTEFSFDGLTTLIDNTLTFSLSGKENYRVINQEQDYVSDKVLASGDLTKYRNTAAALNFVTPNPEYVGLAIQTSYSETTTDESIESEFGVDGSNTALSAKISEGRKVDNFSFNLSANYNDTTRASFQDFSSTEVSGDIGVPISQKVSLIVQGSSSEYDVDTSGFATRTNLDTTSYGAGITWQPMNERSVSVTYNQLEEGDNTTNYLGLDVDWAFSSRTALNFNYGKKFYGDAYTVDFSHNLKFFRSSLAYSEQVTSFSRLSFGEGSTTLFVCPFGSVDLGECFQPDSLNYELQAGEEYIASTDIETDISEEIILRKAGSFNIGYDKRRLKTALTVSYGETEYLESGQLQTTRSAKITVAYELGKKTDVNFSSRYARTRPRSSDDTDNILTSSIDVSREVAKSLKVNLGARLLDRSSDSADRDITDKRITLGLTYTF